jgi:4'-phosphopantetheinyl transferase
MIPTGEIHVVTFSLDLPGSRLRQCERLLSPDESARAERFHQARDRRRYIAGRGQLKAILGLCLDRHPAELQFRYGSHGKPALEGGGGFERVRFNMSRSHDLGLLAIQLDDDIGVDLERIRPFPDSLPVARRFFTPEEHQALAALPAAELDAAFFGLWTRKEAVVKSIGLGLSYPMNAFSLSSRPGPSPEHVVVQGGGGAETRWLLPVPPPCPGYVAAVATARSPHAVRWWTWTGREH